LGRKLIECVANFSEGRDAAVVEAVSRAVEQDPGVRVLDATLDADHHRCVVTFAGTPEAVLPAAVRAVGEAVRRIDLNRHSGVHPRLGAADVLPLVPVENITLEECAELAHRLGDEIWRALAVPVYFYEAAALRPERRLLESVRKGGFEGVREAVASGDTSRRPDIGGPALHPTAGAVIVGARKFLIAWNVNLDSTDLAAAKAIAKAIRASSGGFPHLKALGLPLESRRQVQVSMNLTDFDVTPMHVVFEAIRRKAGELGVEIAGTEIIGLLPRAALERAAASYFRFENFAPEVVLEQKVESMLRL
jgi:glutamate formiminotransferase/glutamate formiminotransferase/formiminotetrahydrofolate cyclodeaminase